MDEAERLQRLKEHAARVAVEEPIADKVERWNWQRKKATIALMRKRRRVVVSRRPARHDYKQNGPSAARLLAQIARINLMARNPGWSG